MSWQKAEEDWGADFESHAGAMLDLYCRTLSDLGYNAAPYADTGARVGESVVRGGKFEAMNHAMWMCTEAKRFVAQGRRAKAYRWIGMIQGLVWMGGVFSIDELKTHNALPPADWPRQGAR